MKYRSALGKSRAALPIGIGFAVVLGGVAWAWSNWFSYTLFAFALVGVIVDGVNILYIRRKAARDPKVLDCDAP